MKDNCSAGWRKIQVHFVGRKYKDMYNAKIHKICDSHSIKDIQRIPKGDRNTC